MSTAFIINRLLESSGAGDSLALSSSCHAAATNLSVYTDLHTETDNSDGSGCCVQQWTCCGSVVSGCVTQHLPAPCSCVLGTGTSSDNSPHNQCRGQNCHSQYYQPGGTAETAPRQSRSCLFAATAPLLLLVLM